jgi:hypothetical protein
MQGETKQKWMTLCEQAAAEQDPQKLLDLVQQINDLLEAKERRLGIDTTPRSPRSSVDEERESESVA